MANNNHFELTLDTLAPSGSISRGTNMYVKNNFALTITKPTETSQAATFMKVWFNSNPTGAKTDDGYLNGTWEAANVTKQTNFTSEGTYYYHLVLMDDVNNESDVYNTEVIIFDTSAPTITDAHLEDPNTHDHSYTNQKTGIVVKVTASDTGLSGLSKIIISGDDVKDSPITVDNSSTSYTGTIDFISGVQDGTKTVTITVVDAAGNESTTTTSIYLDTGISALTLQLLTSAEESLPAYINYHDIKVRLNSSDTDIKAYKIWEGDTEPDAWVSSEEPYEFPIIVEKTLSANDGTKVIHAKVKDQAGSIATATAAQVIIDSVDPIVSISTSRTTISNVTIYATAVLSLEGTDATAGVKSYTLKCGDTVIDSGTTVPATFNLTSSNSMVEGANTITLTVTDNAENSNSASCVVNLDTTAPTVTIATLNEWYNTEFNITVSHVDAIAGSQAIASWSSTVPEDTSVPSGATSVEADISGTTTISANQIKWGLAQSANNYVHVRVTDNVGNVGYAHAKFGYDNLVSNPTVSFTKSAYGTTAASINIGYSSDDVSGIAYMNVSGDITNGTASGEWEEISVSKSVTLTTGDGTKTVYVKIKDTAGNISESVSATTELDTVTPAANISLFKADGITAKPAISNEASFSARIWPTGDPGEEFLYYAIYGDFVGGKSTPGDDDWQTYTPDSGKDYKLITNLQCTSGDGPKNISVIFKDNAGNVSDAATATFTYDTTPPIVVVSNVDYNRISKINTLRRNSTGVIEGKYADETNFIFTPDSNITEYKVCAYENATAAAAGTHDDHPIPMTNGSLNMSGTLGEGAKTPVQAKIKGADYEIALGGASTTGEHDGAHIVVVYVKDEGGTWSAAASFEN